MKKVFLALCSLMASSVIYLGCTPSNQEPVIESFRLVAWDNANDGQIDQESGIIHVRHISSGEQVRTVDFTLSNGSEITPDPQTLINKWPEKVNFTIKNGKKTKEYTVILSDYVKPEDEQHGPEWRIAWNDEFNINSIDTVVWSKTPRGPKGMCTQHMTDAEDLYEFKDGKIFLYGKENDHPEDTVTHLTGGIWTKDKKCFSLGRMDIRAKVTSGKGYWPAIWLLPQGNSKPYSEGGELDIVEHLNFDDFVYQTMHTRYTNLVNRSNPMNYTMAKVNLDEYNTYSVIVSNDKVEYMVNNVVTHVYPKLVPEQEYQFPFSTHAYYVLFTSQLGGDWVGDIDLKGETVYLSIDWIRVYTKKQ